MRIELNPIQRLALIDILIHCEEVSGIACPATILLPKIQDLAQGESLTINLMELVQLTEAINLTIDHLEEPYLGQIEDFLAQ